MNNKITKNREFAIELMRELKLPFSIRYHSHSVAKKALNIANKIKKIELDKNLIEVGALLHDIGRTQTHGFKHGMEGGKILKLHGCSEELIRICETHILGGLDKEDAKKVGLPEKDFLPKTIEEKIVCLADKYMKGTKEVSIDQRFKKWFSKYGRTEILLKSRRRIKKIKSDIEALF
ncbi:MAG: HDIG domain-containing metalloprotein [Promethearchaeota archaeon]